MPVSTTIATIAPTTSTQNTQSIAGMIVVFSLRNPAQNVGSPGQKARGDRGTAVARSRKHGSFSRWHAALHVVGVVGLGSYAGKHVLREGRHRRASPRVSLLPFQDQNDDTGTCGG